MKQIRTEIIGVGTELLLGQIANTNAQWISEKLAKNGFNVFHHAVVGDNLQRVINQFTHSESRSDIIIVTGGLGPTEDDMTREAFQQISNLEMVEHKPSMDKIETFFRKRESVMTANNRRQARVFKGAEAIENEVGMAPGMIVQHQHATWIFLPGVPREMKQMVEHRVIPHLKQQTGLQTVIKSAMLRFVGIGESTLEDQLKDIIQKQHNPTIAPLAQNEGVAIRVTAKASDDNEANQLIEKTKQEILSVAGAYFYGSDEETLPERVFSLLKTQGKMIAAAESLTGGMFTDRLISLEGASKVCSGGIVCYDAKVKENVLKVSPDTIKKQGTVSEQCAREMAENVCTLMDVEVGISFTGVAGPDYSENNPPGTVFIGVAQKGKETFVKKFIFQGDRDIIRNRSVIKGFELLWNLLKIA
ncbi:competence/damage-inducible protein A [Virgibacillus siamensis]|uniref:competence/damage-inducible protein A n=1 Tax=Virgibacillus siamensis TaxID=480071 RepID=UPI0009879FD8|nr:competence/damage-inducible protein A [Virgibacillus siamensis]